jgi:hypothetical protein
MPRPEPSKYVYCADEETNFAAVVKVDGDTLREVARHTGAPVGSCCRCGVDSSVAESDAGVQDIGSAVVDQTPGDDIELWADHHGEDGALVTGAIQSASRGPIDPPASQLER